MVKALRVVLDNSVTLGWFHPQQLTDYGQAVLDHLGRAEFLVPAHWTLELGNSLWQLERRKRLERAQRMTAMREALALPLKLLPASFDLVRVSALAEQHALTTYDAAYLDCANTQDALLATQDKALKAAAQSAGRWFDTKKH